MEPQFRPGDVFLSGSPSLLGKLIRRFQRRKGEDPSVVNHVGLFVTGGDPVHALTLEALWRVRRATFAAWMYNYDGDVWVYRHTSLEMAERAAIVAYATRTYKPGMRYGWWKLLLHVVGLQGLSRIRSRPICSLLVGDSYEQAIGYRFLNVPGLEAEPDDIWDDVTFFPSWQLVWTTSRNGRPPNRDERALGTTDSIV